MKKIQVGDSVTVNYTGKLEDGSIFDSSLNEGREPLSAKLGDGKLINGFENGLIGMSIGETKTIEIEPEDAYGRYNEQLVVEVPKERMPENINVGETLQGNSPQGPVIVKVIEVKDDVILIDANHPLAGKKLIFELEVVGISE